jgi:hypothetical protein
LEILKWARNNHCNWNSWTCSNAAKIWAIENLGVANGNQTHILEWIISFTKII